MGSLFTTLFNSTGALRVYERSFQVIENNIVNANTPGYARQDQTIVSLPFNLAGGLPGGILAGGVRSARSEFLDQSVRTRQESSGYADQRATDLSQVEPLFDLTSRFGVPGSLNKFFNSFSQLAVNPNDAVARQSVIDLAGGVTDSFHQTAVGLTQVSTDADRQIAYSVSTVNRLAGQIARINSQYRGGPGASEDAGLATELSSTLEELSNVANFSLIKTPDGAVNVYLGGQVPLVIGERTYATQADFSAPQTAVRDASGNDVTALITRGQLGALLETRNTTIPGYLGDLHSLAQNFADKVNAQLALGVDKSGAVPVTNLFAYNAAADAASTISVTNITPDQIAAALPTAPGGNGNALAIADLANQQSIGGFTFTQFFGNLGSRVGRDLTFARQDQQQFKDSVIQAQAQRKDQTGVSLDEEATKLIQFQKAYQAVGKLVTVIDDLTQTVLNIIK